MVKLALSRCVSLLMWPCFLGVAFIYALWLRRQPLPLPGKERLVFGATPILNLMYWSAAMRAHGYETHTLVNGFYARINKRSDWDSVLDERFHQVPARFRKFVGFLWALGRFDVFFVSFNGFLLGGTRFQFLESRILRLAGKKIIITPYGGDAYVYRNIRSLSLLHCLMISYPAAAREQDVIEARVRHWTRMADAVVIGNMGPDGFGRWDVLAPSALHIDSDKWVVSSERRKQPGDPVVIGHMPNHRGVKGTEFLIRAVEQLQAEGCNVELLLIEGRQNEEVRELMQTQVDILVENLNMTGYGLTGLEGMACSLPVISNFENDATLTHFRRWSFLSECPIVSGCPENIQALLKRLVGDAALRAELGRAGRAYVEKYHSLQAAHFLFSRVIEYVYGRREHAQMINLFHPLLGERAAEAKVSHPLLNNRLPD